jgi:exopolyphosphatase/pppGpp-phosphohydrolase
MGGGSTEVGLCSRTKEEIKLLHWISFPYGLFYFGKNTDLSKVVSDQTKILMNGFVQKCNEIIQKPVPFIISRSGIMSTLSKYISHKMNDSKFGNYNKMIDLSKAIESIKDIINIQNNNKLNIKFLNRTHLKSMRGSFFFTLFIMESLPINSLVLNNGGVKEGMMFLAARNKLFV